jgi:hypothetical protein
MSISILGSLCGTSAINWVAGQQIQTSATVLFNQTKGIYSSSSVCLSPISDAVRTKNTPAAILSPSAILKRLNDKWENVGVLMVNPVCLRQDRLTVCRMLVCLHKILLGIQFDMIWYICQLQLGCHPVAVVQYTFTQTIYRTTQTTQTIYRTT